MGHDSLQEVMPLCEIVDYQVDAGYRGKVTITVQLRSVGRASKVELTRMKPFMMGLCKEFFENFDQKDGVLQEANNIVNDIERITVNYSCEDTAWWKEEYLKAFNLALGAIRDTATPEKNIPPMLTTDMLSPNKEDTKNVTNEILKEACTRSWDELSASSWAVFLVISHNNNVNKVGAGEILYKALSSTSVIQRLQMGLRSLLEKAYTG